MYHFSGPCQELPSLETNFYEEPKILWQTASRLHTTNLNCFSTLREQETGQILLVAVHPSVE